MSETVNTGAVLGAINSCTKALSEAADNVQKAIDEIVKKVSEINPRLNDEINRLLKASSPPKVCSPARARQHMDKMAERLKKSLLESDPQASIHSDIASLIAFKNNPLSRFAEPDDINRLHKGESWSSIKDQVTNKASQKMADYSCQHVASSLKDAASKEGFKTVKRHKKRGQGIYMSLSDKNGRAVIGLMQASDTGTKVHIDLAGFNGGTCHKTMENLLRRMQQDDIRLVDPVRKPHSKIKVMKYLPEQLKLVELDEETRKLKGGGQDLRRRQQAQNKNAAKVRVKIRS